MAKRIFLFIVIAAIISACGNTCNKEDSSKAESLEKAGKIEFASLIENPDNYVGKNISVEGKVVHVCVHSGKKLFIVGKDPDVRLFITAGEDMPRFPMELLGSEVVVEGLISLAGGPELGSGKKHKDGEGKTQTTECAEEAPSGENCVTETALAVQPSLSNIVMAYHSHTVK
jgi:hypothetical protein